MTKRAPRKSVGDFSELERAFFEAAPPEVPVIPAEALRFDDLDPIGERARPERRRRPRVERRTAIARPAPVGARLGGAWQVARGAAFWGWRRSRAATVQAWRSSLAAMLHGSRVAWTRARTLSGPHAERAFQSLIAGLSVLSLARATLTRRARATLARLAAELPGERIQGKTAGAMVAIAVFFVIAAGVVAQRPALSAPRADATTSLAP